VFLSPLVNHKNHRKLYAAMGSACWLHSCVH